MLGSHRGLPQLTRSIKKKPDRPNNHDRAAPVYCCRSAMGIHSQKALTPDKNLWQAVAAQASTTTNQGVVEPRNFSHIG